MKNIYENSGVILSFLVLVLVAHAITGEKFTRNMLLLILFGQLITNPDIVDSFMKGKKEEETETPKKTSTTSTIFNYGGVNYL